MHFQVTTAHSEMVTAKSSLNPVSDHRPANVQFEPPASLQNLDKDIATVPSVVDSAAPIKKPGRRKGPAREPRTRSKSATAACERRARLAGSKQTDDIKKLEISASPSMAAHVSSIEQHEADPLKAEVIAASVGEEKKNAESHVCGEVSISMGISQANLESPNKTATKSDAACTEERHATLKTQTPALVVLDERILPVGDMQGLDVHCTEKQTKTGSATEPKPANDEEHVVHGVQHKITDDNILSSNTAHGTLQEKVDTSVDVDVASCQRIAGFQAERNDSTTISLAEGQTLDVSDKDTAACIQDGNGLQRDGTAVDVTICKEDNMRVEAIRIYSNKSAEQKECVGNSGSEFASEKQEKMGESLDKTSSDRPACGQTDEDTHGVPLGRHSPSEDKSEDNSAQQVDGGDLLGRTPGVLSTRNNVASQEAHNVSPTHSDKAANIIEVGISTDDAICEAHKDLDSQVICEVPEPSQFSELKLEPLNQSKSSGLPAAENVEKTDDSLDIHSPSLAESGENVLLNQSQSFIQSGAENVEETAAALNIPALNESERKKSPGDNVHDLNEGMEFAGPKLLCMIPMPSPDEKSTEVHGSEQMMTVSAAEPAPTKDDQEQKMHEVHEKTLDASILLSSEEASPLQNNNGNSTYVDSRPCQRDADFETGKSQSSKIISAGNQASYEASDKDQTPTEDDSLQSEHTVIDPNSAKHGFMEIKDTRIDDISKGSSSDLAAALQSDGSNHPAEQNILENIALISASANDSEKMEDTFDKSGDENPASSHTVGDSHNIDLVGYSPSEEPNENKSAQLADVSDLVGSEKATIDVLSAATSDGLKELSYRKSVAVSSFSVAISEQDNMKVEAMQIDSNQPAEQMESLENSGSEFASEKQEKTGETLDKNSSDRLSCGQADEDTQSVAFGRHFPSEKKNEDSSAQVVDGVDLLGRTACVLSSANNDGSQAACNVLSTHSDEASIIEVSASADASACNVLSTHSDEEASIIEVSTSADASVCEAHKDPENHVTCEVPVPLGFSKLKLEHLNQSKSSDLPDAENVENQDDSLDIHSPALAESEEKELNQSKTSGQSGAENVEEIAATLDIPALDESAGKKYAGGDVHDLSEGMEFTVPKVQGMIPMPTTDEKGTEVHGSEEEMMVSAAEPTSTKDEQEQKTHEVHEKAVDGIILLSSEEENPLQDNIDSSTHLDSCPSQKIADFEGEKSQSIEFVLADSQAPVEVSDKDQAPSEDGQTGLQSEDTVIGPSIARKNSMEIKAMENDGISKGSSGGLPAALQPDDSIQTVGQNRVENNASIFASSNDQEKMEDTFDKSGCKSSTPVCTDGDSHNMNLVGYSPSEDSNEDESAQVTVVGDVIGSEEITVDVLSAASCDDSKQLSCSKSVASSSLSLTTLKQDDMEVEAMQIDSNQSAEQKETLESSRLEFASEVKKQDEIEEAFYKFRGERLSCGQTDEDTHSIALGRRPSEQKNEDNAAQVDGGGDLFGGTAEVLSATNTDGSQEAPNISSTHCGKEASIIEVRASTDDAISVCEAHEDPESRVTCEVFFQLEPLHQSISSDLPAAEKVENPGDGLNIHSLVLAESGEKELLDQTKSPNQSGEETAATLDIPALDEPAEKMSPGCDVHGTEVHGSESGILVSAAEPACTNDDQEQKIHVVHEKTLYDTMLLSSKEENPLQDNIDNSTHVDPHSCQGNADFESEKSQSNEIILGGGQAPYEASNKDQAPTQDDQTGLQSEDTIIDPKGAKHDFTKIKVTRIDDISKGSSSDSPAALQLDDSNQPAEQNRVEKSALIFASMNDQQKEDTFDKCGVENMMSSHADGDSYNVNLVGYSPVEEPNEDVSAQLADAVDLVRSEETTVDVLSASTSDGLKELSCSKTVAFSSGSVTISEQDNMKVEAMQIDSNQSAEQKENLENSGLEFASEKQQDKMGEAIERNSGDRPACGKTDDGAHGVTLGRHSPSKDKSEGNSAHVVDVGDLLGGTTGALSATNTEGPQEAHIVSSTHSDKEANIIEVGVCTGDASVCEAHKDPDNHVICEVPVTSGFSELKLELLNQSKPSGLSAAENAEKADDSLDIHQSKPSGLSAAENVEKADDSLDIHSPALAESREKELLNQSKSAGLHAAENDEGMPITATEVPCSDGMETPSLPPDENTTLEIADTAQEAIPSELELDSCGLVGNVTLPLSSTVQEADGLDQPLPSPGVQDEGETEK